MEKNSIKCDQLFVKVHIVNQHTLKEKMMSLSQNEKCTHVCRQFLYMGAAVICT